MSNLSTTPSTIIRKFLQSQAVSLGQFDADLPADIVTQFKNNPTISCCNGSNETIEYLIVGDFDLEHENSTQKTIKLKIGKCIRYYNLEGKFIKIG